MTKQFRDFDKDSSDDSDSDDSMEEDVEQSGNYLYLLAALPILILCYAKVDCRR